MPDRYTYPGTEVLINSQGIREPQAARLAESQWVSLRDTEIASLSGPFDLKRLQKTHKAHFGGFYEWAGQLRTEGMMFKQRDSGQVVQYPPSNRVEPYVQGIFEQLRAEQPNLRSHTPEQIAPRLAYYYSELDAAHPFRDGNSRTIRQFTADLAHSAGYRLDWPGASATTEGIKAIYEGRDAAVMRGDASKLTQIFQEHIAPLGQHRTIAEERRLGPLEAELGKDQAQSFRWVSENGTIQSFQHKDTNGWLHVDGATGKFVDRHAQPIGREAALQNATAPSHDKAIPAKTDQGLGYQV